MQQLPFFFLTAHKYSETALQILKISPGIELLDFCSMSCTRLLLSDRYVYSFYCDTRVHIAGPFIKRQDTRGLEIAHPEQFDSAWLCECGSQLQQHCRLRLQEANSFRVASEGLGSGKSPCCNEAVDAQTGSRTFL